MPPRFSDLKHYCEKKGWVLTQNTVHWCYERVLANGDILQTKVSHALHKEIPGNLWQRILRKQLKITEEEFWSKK